MARIGIRKIAGRKIGEFGCPSDIVQLQLDLVGSGSQYGVATSQRGNVGKGVVVAVW